MKMNKKKVFVAALAICLVAILSFGTLAWFSDSDASENKFFVTNSDETDPEKIFSIDVKEDVEGETDPVDNYEFDDLVPNQTVAKKPYVINTGAYDQWVRATVTITDYNVFAAALGEDYVMETVFGGIKPEWIYDSKVIDTTAENGAGTISYVFYLNRVLTATVNDPDNDTSVLFETVTIPKELKKEDFAAPSTLSDGFSIKVFAEAIQAENTVAADFVGTDAEKAKKAFELID